MNDIKLLGNVTIEPDKDDKKYRKITLIVLGVFIAVFAIWGSLAKLSSAVPASGKITVASNNKIIDHYDGGIVEKIFIKDGDYVKAGQVLIKLDDTKSIAELKAIESAYYQNLALYDRLLAEKMGSSTIKFNSEFSDSYDQATKDTYVKAQQYEFNTRKAELNSQFAIYNERTSQLTKQSDSISAEIATKMALSSSYAEKIAALQKLYNEKLVDKQQLTDETRQKINVDGSIASLTADQAKVGAQITEVKAQVFEIKQNFLKDVAAKLSDAQTRVTELRGKVDSLRETVARTDIKAPSDGYVVGLAIHTVGSVVAPGKPIMDIVPIDEALIAECMVNPSDIYYVIPNSPVKLTFPSFTHIKSLKDVDGVVVDIAADAHEDPATKTSYYKIKVRLNASGEEELAKNNLRITPGMPVEAMIITGERTFLQYLVKPFENMLRSGMREQ